MRLYLYHWMGRNLTDEEIPGVFSQGKPKNPKAKQNLQWVEVLDFSSFVLNLTNKFDVMLVGEQEFKNIEELPEGKYHCVYLDDKGKLFKQR
jgi:hypothetical protein